MAARMPLLEPAGEYVSINAVAVSRRATFRGFCRAGAPAFEMCHTGQEERRPRTPHQTIDAQREVGWRNAGRLFDRH